jgi:hypothetical protein
MRRGAQWLARTCWGWRFYIAGFLGWTALGAVLFLTQSRWDFIHSSRDVGTVGIALTIVYKIIIIAIMVVTRPKTTLDRRWIWHMASIGLLFAYAFGLNVWPELYGQPKPGVPLVRIEPSNRMVIAAVVWFQFWGGVMWSALAVLVSVWDERGRYAWYGMTRRLRPLGTAETP